MVQLSFFIDENRIKIINIHGDTLERLARRINWKKFIPLPNNAMKKEKKETRCPHYP